MVAVSFTEPQQRIYELSTRQGLRGQALAAALGITQEKANTSTAENIERLERGFGAYILAREGRPFCPVLARILDSIAWDGQAFSRVLRLRILKHLDTCATCGNCETCRVAKRRLVRPYTPALLPILAGIRVREHVMSAARNVAAVQPARLPQTPPRPPAPPPAGPSAPPAAESSAPPAAESSASPSAGSPARPGLARSGRAARRLRLPALAGAAAVVPFVLALLVTRVAVAGGSPSGAGTRLQTVAATMPAIAYGSGTSVVVRYGTTPPQTLASLSAGTVVSQLFWSWDRRWLGWFSGPPQGATSQVHITDVTTGVTHSWPCNGCSGGAFQGTNLLTSGEQQSSVMAYPVSGGAPVPVTTFPAGPAGLSGNLLGSTPHAAAVVFVAGSYEPVYQLKLYESTTVGQPQLLAQLPNDAAPGGDRNSGAPGMIGLSPDGNILAYAGNVLGSDTGEGSDSVTVINLRALSHVTVDLPADRAQPLRISAVWVDSSDTVFASAWHQPGNVDTGGTMPDVAVTPQVYRLEDGHWTGTGQSTPSEAGGQDGWTALIKSGSAITSYKPSATGDLVAVFGTTEISLAARVTAFAWAPTQR